MPLKTDHWIGRDISGEIDLNDRRYNFIGSFLARRYASDLGESLLFLAVDAINFHHPRGCFDSSGFLVHALDDVNLEASGKKWTAHVYFMDKGRESVLVVYWICIDKKVVNWAEQRIQQLFHSMFGKKKAGFMLRLDIPVRKENLGLAIATAKDFIRTIGREIPPDQSSYLFGS